LEYFYLFLSDYLVSVLAFLFLCLPYPFSYLGMVAISFILPCFRCVSLVDQLKVHYDLAVEHENHQQIIINQEQQQLILEKKKQLLKGKVLRWIHYWICMLGIWIFRIYVCNMWSTIIILVSLWLQHACFKGAITFVSTVTSYFKALKRNTTTIGDVERVDELFQPVPDEIEVFILDSQEASVRERGPNHTPTLLSRLNNAMEDGSITDSDSRIERSENSPTNNTDRNKAIRFYHYSATIKIILFLEVNIFSLSGLRPIVDVTA
jgi:hypothetical protein